MMTFEERRRLPGYAQELKDAWRSLSPAQKEALEAIIIQTADNRKRVADLLKPEALPA